jgi:hypothetical protein
MSSATERSASGPGGASSRIARGRALAEKMIAAHGGIAAWERADAITLHMRGGGLLLVSKRQPRTMRHVEVTVSTTGQRTVIRPYPRAGHVGVFESGSVRIETESGELVERRADPRPLFRKLRRQLRWDELDLLYFSGYALWNYVSVPFVLLREGYELETKDDRTLVVTFPEGVHTHCRRQRFRLDDRGLLRQHLYTAEPVGRWARSVHVASEHKESGGLVFPTKRRVYPRGLGGVRIPFPVLVRIDIDGVEISQHEGRSEDDNSANGGR